MNEYDDEGTPFDQDILQPDYEQEEKERFRSRWEVEANSYVLGGIPYEPPKPQEKKQLTCFTPIEIDFLKVLEVWNDEASNQKKRGYKTKMTEHKIDHQNPSKTLQRIIKTIADIATGDWLERQQALAKPADADVTTLNFKPLYTDEMVSLVRKYAQMFDPDFEPTSKHNLPREILDFFCKDTAKQRNGKVLIEPTYESWILTVRDTNFKIKRSSKPDAKFVENIFHARVPSGRLFFDIIGDSLANLENRKEQYVSVMWEQHCWWKEWTRNFGAINIGIGDPLYIQNFSAYIMWATKELQAVHFENKDRDENNLVKVPIGCLRTESKTFQAFQDEQKRYGYRWDWEKLIFLAQAKRRWDKLHFGKSAMYYVTAEDGTEKPTFLTEEEYEEATDFGWQTADKIV